MDDFETLTIETEASRVHVRRGGRGRPVLLLHGFPQTLHMWRDIAPLLAEDFTVVCADLRGYGGSGCPPSAADHEPYSKRAMAREMAAVMADLGFERFSIAGHDRGGRVAYRAALDHPDRVERLAVLDIVPIAAAWDRADDRLALGLWPWSLLAQTEPLPERLVGAASEAVIENVLSEWGTPADVFDADTRAHYLAQLQDPEHLHAICEEYRAAAGIDRDDDRADRAAGNRIACPCSSCGAKPVASGPGTPTRAARSRCGASSRRKSAATPSPAATSSPRSTRTTRRAHSARSSPPTTADPRPRASVPCPPPRASLSSTASAFAIACM
jgi:haloacetate dehalogenase